MSCGVPFGKPTCTNPAVCRVRLYEIDDDPHEMDLCGSHAHEAAGEYPDNIEMLLDYR